MIARTSLRPLRTLSIVLLSMLVPATALAAPSGGGGGLPWESSFSKILDSIQGMAPMFATIAFLIAGVIWMFGESGGMSRVAESGVGTPFGERTVTRASPIPS